ncbi:RsmD family RNA methyltransferase [Salinicola rhizosphaerae]|uniref:23S rRNA (Uracil(1939)-C(5))-methyltransferase RlmD n=1 Tax=Salinicola rhizosphaerae TaxID=1443141 RepID=A0ABQ3DNY0_9GAMM|nr:RsmD family RNA methyltransferase [Salinicola rhizosphaerae]GHB08294.1 23S rRNA (uracil(1939)-C(5))-methyltransferase RlmD [Salinicola rhizosphaerae]
MAMLGKRRTPSTRARAQGSQGAESPLPQAITPGALVIERLAHDGRGVTRSVVGKTVFVDRALPGEQVEIAVHRERRRFDEAHVRRRLIDAATRVTPPCEHYERCGGCDLQHMAIEAQRDHKRQVLTELLARQGIEPPRTVDLLSGRDAGYRRRARLGVKVSRDGEVHLGFRVRGSDQLIDIDSCYVLAPSLAALLQPLRRQLQSLAAPRHVGHIELLAGDDGAAHVIVRQLRSVPEDARRWAEFATRERLALALREGREAPVLRWLGGPGAAPASLTTRVDAGGQPISLGFEPGDFLQVNAEINQQLIDRAREWLELDASERLLDLFAGIGNFALSLAPDVDRVTAVEGSQAMVERLNDNARCNGFETVEARQADLSTVDGLLETWLAEHDVVVLDPPRDGADAICRRLGASAASRVLYVSCDPASLARDAAHLRENGFCLERLAIADMFPHTAHLESMVLFSRGTATAVGGRDSAATRRDRR